MAAAQKRPPWPLVLALPAIALTLSGIITATQASPFADDFIRRWWWSFVVALPVLPVALFLSAAIERMLAGRLSSRSVTTRRLVVSIITAGLIEFSIATAVTWSNLGLAAVFGRHWLSAFLQSLPVGMLIALLMNFVIKPRYLESRGFTTGRHPSAPA